MSENTEVTTQSPGAATSSGDDKKIRMRLAILGFALFLVFVIGLFWFATNPEMGAGLTLSFIAGLSMIFLPCTLPMAFVIVPLAMGKNPMKGFLMALSFGLGLSVTLSFYGVAVAAAGAFFGLTAATQFMLILGGTAALIFGLSEIRLLNFRLPTYSGKFPDWIQKRGDYIKVFLLGVFLGNAGVGCPNPAFYVLLGYVATLGDVVNGWILLFVHGLGRAVPLIFLAILGILGVNATSKLVGKQEIIEKYMGWILVVMGSFILTFGLFGHDWFVASGIHTGWEKVVVNVAGDQFGENIIQHEHRLVDTSGILPYGNMFFLSLILLTIILYKIRLKPAKGEMRYPVILFVIVFFIVGAATDWTWKLGSQGHGGHGSQETEDVDPNSPRGLLDGKRVGEGGAILDDSGDPIPNAGVTSDGHIVYEGEIIEGAHVMPDNTVMVMQMVSSSHISQLPKRGPENRVEELPYVIKDGVKEFRLTVDEFQWEYEPDRFVHAWGYNGQVPGPTIRVNEGDRVRVIVTNNLPENGTSVHWHGQHLGEGNWSSDGVPGLTQEAIAPGDSYTYEFDAISVGTRWYHSHGESHISVAQQVDMGLSGVFITEPEVQTLEYDKEYTMLLDEWDILPGGVNPAVGHVHGAATPGAVPEYNTFTINGNIFPFIEPIKVKEGEKVLIRVVNGGTSAFHPMHTHGHDFELVALDGNPVPNDPQKHNTFTLHPGETADFLLTADNPGNWLLHCHHAHHAAAGMIMLIEYEGFDAPTTSDLREMVMEQRVLEGLHIMSDGTVMLMSGEVLDDAEVLGPGVVRLGNGVTLDGVMDLRNGGSMDSMDDGHMDHAH